MEKTVGILGMAYKAEIDDIRDSLSYKLKKALVIEAKHVLCSDPYVKDGTLVPVHDLIKASDIVIVGAPHKEYKTLDFGQTVVVDVWNYLENAKNIF